jgi:hypothetical protein
MRMETLLIYELGWFHTLIISVAFLATMDVLGVVLPRRMCTARLTSGGRRTSAASARAARDGQSRVAAGGRPRAIKNRAGCTCGGHRWPPPSGWQVVATAGGGQTTSRWRLAMEISNVECQGLAELSRRLGLTRRQRLESPGFKFELTLLSPCRLNGVVDEKREFA